MISFTNSFCTLRSHEFPSFLESIKASLRNFKTQGMTDILSEQLSAKKCRFLDPLVDFQPSLWKKVVSYPPFSSSTVISAWKTLENLPIGQPFFVQMTGANFHEGSRLGPTNPTLIEDIQVKWMEKQQKNIAKNGKE